MKGVLIFGGHGRLGTDICRELEKRDIPYSAPTRKKSRDARVIYHPGLEVSCVINCIAQHTADCEDSSMAYTINARIPYNLSKYCSHNKWKFVQISTDYVLGASENHLTRFGQPLYDPSALTDPVGNYGKSKLSGELFALANNSNTLVVRTASLFGSSNTDRSDFVKTVLGFVDNDKEMSVVNDVIMTPSYTPSVAESIVQAAVDYDLRGMIHLSNDRAMSWYSLACLIAGESKRHLIKAITKDRSPDHYIPRPVDSSLICNEIFNSNFTDLSFTVNQYLKHLRG